MAQQSQAYDLALFEKKQAKVIPLKVDQEQTRKRQKRQRLQKTINMIVSALAGIGIVAIVAMMIVTKVQLTEMNNQITVKQQQVGELLAQAECLRGELAAQTSAQSIEEYAKQHNMQKVDAGQNLYVSVDTQDVIEVTQQQDEGLLAQLWASLVQLFS